MRIRLCSVRSSLSLRCAMHILFIIDEVTRSLSIDIIGVYTSFTRTNQPLSHTHSIRKLRTRTNLGCNYPLHLLHFHSATHHSIARMNHHVFGIHRF
jgi:hypothetical protein